MYNKIITPRKWINYEKNSFSYSASNHGKQKTLVKLY